MKKLLPGWILASLILSSCGQPQTRVAHELWYKNTKERILQQSSQEPDSVRYTFNQDSTLKTAWQYHDKHLMTKKGFQQSIFRFEINYSKDGLFELRREMCENGKLAFEGIFYKNEAYGLSTWYDCKGNPINQGVKYKDQSIGSWKSWKKPMETPAEMDYGNNLPLDSFPTLKKY
ncbi:hypothetical protein CLV59_107377 [Chitinophaga dinghuensis]|uniref:MORN repeat protein n=1 Tax=Chitinophaga dinghuensis TaxID=1539050 RepID=A0A327VUA4_9BACT|nr:hypothetical protein [Chitinophaga dinghuensis]RAJ77609.1 hypothetical protein CLV59_107377 [Chitinophaga dinghuensis]